MYSPLAPVIGVFLAARRGPCEIEHHLERFSIRSRASYILPATALTCYNGRVFCSYTRNRRGGLPPSAQLPPEESCTGQKNGRCSTIQNESFLPHPRRQPKPIEVRKTFTAGTEMIDPRINFWNRDLMARQALQNLRVRTADSIRVGESFCQLSIEES
jgi:hypothetical protein